MFNRQNKRPFGRSSGFGNQRPGANRFGSQGRPRFGGKAQPRSRNGESKIDISKLVVKAIKLEDEKPFVPTFTYTTLPVDNKLKENILKKGYTNPTPIQDMVIPHVLMGKDVVGIANTGTGKTGAFLIPLVEKVIAKKNEQILIMCPTRELATQIQEELRSLVIGLNIHSVCAVGGMSIGKQISEMRYHNNFVIGTPGRLKDLMERGFFKPQVFSTVVLDEADRMLDMGFLADMKLILGKMLPNRQTLFFSATMSKEIEVLVHSFLKSPIMIKIKTGETAKSIDQDIVRIGGKDKITVLHDLLISPGFHKVLVFGRTKHGVERLSETLIKRGFKAGSIHGNKNQAKRNRALTEFKDGRVSVLVATDVAARGIDVPDVTHVINFDLPTTYEDYVHRIGRTGRGTKRGKALTLVD